MLNILRAMVLKNISDIVNDPDTDLVIDDAAKIGRGEIIEHHINTAELIGFMYDIITDIKAQLRELE